MAAVLRLLRGRFGRSLRDEWSAAGRLWGHAPLVAPTFSRDAAGIFSSSQHSRHGGIFVERTLEPPTHALLLTEFACDAPGNLAGPRGKSSLAARKLPKICLQRVDSHRPGARVSSVNGLRILIAQRSSSMLHCFPNSSLRKSQVNDDVSLRTRTTR